MAKLLINHVLIVTFSITLCLFAVITMGAAGDEGSKMSTPKPKIIKLSNGTEITAPPNCRKMMLTIAKRQMKFFKSCMDQEKSKYADKEEFNKHFQCVIKCVLETQGMLDETHKISNASVHHFFVNNNIPEDYQGVGYMITGGCIEKWSPHMDNVEPTCLAYGNFVKCLQDYVSDMC